MATATVSEPLKSPRTSVQTEPSSSQTLALSLLSFSASPDLIYILVPAITNLYNMNRPKGIDIGTQTDEKIMKDQSTELKWGLD